MNEKGISEIRRRFRPEKSNITRIRGCYVNEQREIVSEFSQSLALMPQEEAEELLAILKKTLSGTLGKNLIDVEFTTRQVLEGDEHKLLTALRDSSLEDDGAVRAFCERVIGSLSMEGSFLILLACDKYDVPHYAKDGAKQEDSSELFSYFLCSVCPVKLTKPALGYYVSENTFRNITADWAVSPPELGFLFPAFEDRCANLYGSLYYTRSITENHAEFVDAVFKSELPMPAAEQQETFQAVLGDAVAQDCSLEVVQAVQGRLTEMIEEHKADKDSTPPTVSKSTVKGVLEACGVPEERLTEFEEKYDGEFGADAQIAPQNLMDVKQLEISTSGITVKVDPECGDLIETRVIDGIKYILIRAEDSVEVNGVPIHIS